MPKLAPKSIDLNAIKHFLVDEHKKILDATTEIRKDLSRARRNYEMKFDEPYDAATKKRKMFVPLTTQEVDLISSRFDLSPDAIFIKTNEPGLERKAMIWEQLIKSQLNSIDFQTRIKESFIPFTNEGTVVLEWYWDDQKKRPDFCLHDIADVYVFPKEPFLESASGFAIRKNVLCEDFENSDLYFNQKEASETNVVRADQAAGSSSTMKYETKRSEYRTQLEFVELYERYGLFPKSFLTSKEDDEEILVEGVLTIADINGKQTVVRAEERDDRYRFIEAFFQKRYYLWYGLGVGLKLRDYQFYYNKIVNRRDDNEDVLHRGMFIKRRGNNIEARQRITGSGIWIDADDPGAVTQLRTQDITATSYTGEAQLLSGVARLNGTPEITRGGGSSSYSASEAAIKDKNAIQRLSDPQRYLNRLLKKSVEAIMKLDQEFMPKNKVVKLTGYDEALAVFDDFKLSEVNKARAEEGLPPVDPLEFKQAMEQYSGTRFLKIPSIKFLSGDFEVQVDLDSSMIKSKSGIAQLILDSMKIAAQTPGVPERIDFAKLFMKFLDLQGLRVDMTPPPSPQQPMGPGVSGIQGGSPMSQQPQAPFAPLMESAGPNGQMMG